MTRSKEPLAASPGALAREKRTFIQSVQLGNLFSGELEVEHVQVGLDPALLRRLRNRNISLHARGRQFSSEIVTGTISRAFCRDHRNKTCAGSLPYFSARATIVECRNRRPRTRAAHACSAPTVMSATNRASPSPRRIPTRAIPPRNTHWQGQGRGQKPKAYLQRDAVFAAERDNFRPRHERVQVNLRARAFSAPVGRQLRRFRVHRPG